MLRKIIGFSLVAFSILIGAAGIALLATGIAAGVGIVIILITSFFLLPISLLVLVGSNRSNDEGHQNDNAVVTGVIKLVDPGSKKNIGQRLLHEPSFSGRFQMPTQTRNSESRLSRFFGGLFRNRQRQARLSRPVLSLISPASRQNTMDYETITPNRS